MANPSPAALSGRMHEPTPSLREPQRPAVRASRTAPGWAQAKRGLLLALVGGVFLASAGAFGSGEASWPVRYAYWLIVMAGGAAIGAGVSNLVGRRGWFEKNIWLQGALITVLVSIPLTVLVMTAMTGVFGGSGSWRNWPWYAAPVVLISAVMTALNYLVNRTPPQTHAPAEPATAPPVRFLERLPGKLRGSDLYAVEAEDHYLRLHTSFGSDLILLRLADAVAELEGIEGAQTHRSWWVARSAVASAARSDGRATLTLKDGAVAPVSRTYAKALREAGWFD